MALALYLPLVLLSALVGTAIALFAWLHGDTPGAKPLSLFMLAASLWAVIAATSLASPTAEATVFWLKLTVSMSSVVPLAWLLMVLEYAGYDEWLTPRTLLALLVEPILVAAAIWANPLHQTVWSDVSTHLIGPYVAFSASRELVFWIHIGYSYLLVAIGAVFLLRLLLRSQTIYRAQSTALLAAIVIPAAANALYIFRVLPDGVDPTGVSFVFSGAILTVAILRDQLLEVAPAAREAGRDELIAEMDDPVLIVDDDGVLVDVNAAAASLFDVDPTGVFGTQLDSFAPPLAAVVADADDSTQTEVTLPRGEERRHYNVRVSPLDRAYGAITGWIVSLRDVTERRRREQRLDVLNRLLRHNLRNEMNVVRGNAELLAERVDDQSAQQRVTRITSTVDHVMERSEKMSAMSKLDETERRPLDVDATIRDAVTRTRESYPDATISVANDAARECLVTGNRSLTLAFEELLENAIVHNDDPEPTVQVTCSTTDRQLVVAIADDGPGIEQQERDVIENREETPLRHGSGVGLWLASWSIRRAGGSITFAVDDGTTVTVSLPIYE